MDRPVNFSCCTRAIVVMYMEKVPIESMWIVEAKGRRVDILAALKVRRFLNLTI
ncbi:MULTISPECIES: hypothetical protein [Microcystis]|uniref:hypothetical protein n=1 Tax=Microcystis TaxID=1125 RepID=UPI001C98EC1A|nr:MULTISPECIES: hypothetical protein [Microcystis]WNF14907.1 hypothetical protein RKE53_00105 [Microcystis aeruginosa NRERC-214]